MMTALRSSVFGLVLLSCKTQHGVGRHETARDSADKTPGFSYEQLRLDAQTRHAEVERALNSIYKPLTNRAPFFFEEECPLPSEEIRQNAARRIDAWIARDVQAHRRRETSMPIAKLQAMPIQKSNVVFGCDDGDNVLAHIRWVDEAGLSSAFSSEALVAVGSTALATWVRVDGVAPSQSAEWARISTLPKIVLSKKDNGKRNAYVNIRELEGGALAPVVNRWERVAGPSPNQRMILAASTDCERGERESTPASFAGALGIACIPQSFDERDSTAFVNPGAAFFETSSDQEPTSNRLVSLVHTRIAATTFAELNSIPADATERANVRMASGILGWGKKILDEWGAPSKAEIDMATSVWTGTATEALKREAKAMFTLPVATPTPISPPMAKRVMALLVQDELANARKTLPDSARKDPTCKLAIVNRLPSGNTWQNEATTWIHARWTLAASPACHLLSYDETTLRREGLFRATPAAIVRIASTTDAGHDASGALGREYLFDWSFREVSHVVLSPNERCCSSVNDANCRQAKRTKPFVRYPTKAKTLPSDRGPHPKMHPTERF